jgi:hypothetical protein
MPKKCIICSEEARFQVKDTSDFYCGTCAEEQFGDIAMLVKVEDQAQRLRKAMDDRLEQDVEPQEKQDLDENLAD